VTGNLFRAPQASAPGSPVPFDPLTAVAGVAATALLAAVAVAAGALTRPAGVVAAAFGSAILLLAGWPFLALLVLFVFGSVLATRYGFELKQAARLQEGTHGERGVSNVLAHITIPTALALGAWGWPAVLPAGGLEVLFAAALAFGASDTFASEFGVLSGRARSLVSGAAVAAGTNGGVSALGELWAVAGAASTALLGLLLYWAAGGPLVAPVDLFAIAAASGFAGCQIDSVLGATLENRGYLTKGGTNFLSMLATVGVAAVLLYAVGGPL